MTKPTEYDVPIPSSSELSRARRLFLAKEPRAAAYDVSTEILGQAWSNRDIISPSIAVAVLLQSWNFVYYRKQRISFDCEHLKKTDDLLINSHDALDSYRRRQIGSLAPSERAEVITLFGRFQTVVQRVGAAKALHLLAPEFFPLWDNPIGKAYGFNFSVGGAKGSDYWEFMQMSKYQVERMPPVADRTSLKALDEFNYCKFTKHWM